MKESHMFKNFFEVEQYIQNQETKKRIALCGAQDDTALKALVRAKRKGIAEGVLIGDENAINELLESMGEPASDYEIINETNESKSARTAYRYVHEKNADIPMKGLMQSSSFLSAAMNPSFDFLSDNDTLCAVTVFYYPPRDRLMFVADCAINISPTLDDKVNIIKNSVPLIRSFGIETVKVAVVSVIETINPDIISSVDADTLSNMEWDKGIVVEGPFALDNALDVEAAKHKGINSEVAGQADFLLMPDLCAGNIFHKAMHFFGKAPNAGVMCGPKTPVVFNSRTDTPDTKYHSILTAVMQSCMRA